jgi:hypothetical protein
MIVDWDGPIRMNLSSPFSSINPASHIEFMIVDRAPPVLHRRTASEVKQE